MKDQNEEERLTFSRWYTELENYSLRCERAVDDLGPRAEAWLRDAWDAGRLSNLRCDVDMTSKYAIERKDDECS